jgi:hypothetical protein
VRRDTWQSQLPRSADGNDTNTDLAALAPIMLDVAGLALQRGFAREQQVEDRLVVRDAHRARDLVQLA